MIFFQHVMTDKTELTAYFVLLGCVLSLFAIVVILIVILTQERKQYQRLSQVNEPFQSQVKLNMNKTNRMFDNSVDVDFVCISMQHRKESHFDVLAEKLHNYNIKLTWFQGINGKKVNMDEYNLSPRYRQFFLDNEKQRRMKFTETDYRGHLGCTLSHLEVISNVEHMTVILEDDADPVPNFRDELQHKLAAVNRLDPDWEVLLLGWCCNYKDHPYCKLNDTEPIHEGGIVRAHYWIGGWAYLIRSKQVAKKIIADYFNPLDWHIDLTLAEASRLDQLRVYACMPTIVNHSGWLRISSFDFYQVGDVHLLKSDTNNTIPDHVD